MRIICSESVRTAADENFDLGPPMQRRQQGHHAKTEENKKKG